MRGLYEYTTNIGSHWQTQLNLAEVSLCSWTSISSDLYLKYERIRFPVELMANTPDLLHGEPGPGLVNSPVVVIKAVGNLKQYYCSLGDNVTQTFLSYLNVIAEFDQFPRTHANLLWTFRGIPRRLLAQEGRLLKLEDVLRLFWHRERRGSLLGGEGDIPFKEILHLLSGFQVLVLRLQTFLWLGFFHCRRHLSRHSHNDKI